VNLDADRVSELAARPASGLTRRDVALALLSVPSADALGSLPSIRRGLVAAGNPLSAAFWSAAEAILNKIRDNKATVGDVRTWLEATGSEPNGIIGLHIWDEQSQRSQLAAEMHTRLVHHLEDQLAAGEIDPDRLAAADPAACLAYIAVQERWMTSPLADGRVPMDVLLAEKDEEYLAEWDAADAEALAALGELLEQVGERPLPAPGLRAAAGRLRGQLARSGGPDGLPGVPRVNGLAEVSGLLQAHGLAGAAPLLLECSGMTPADLPADDAELWLRLAAGVACPEVTDDWTGPGPDEAAEELSETDAAVAAICAIDHYDWLAVTTALAVGGPGTPATAGDLAGYVRAYDPDGGEAEDGDDDVEPDGPGQEADDAEFDELGLEGLFGPVTALWRVLGAVGEDDRLTELGWWGLPEAMRRVWAPSGGAPA
jgi:hypothetical protein